MDIPQRRHAHTSPMGNSTDDRNWRIAAGSQNRPRKLQNSPSRCRDTKRNRRRNQRRTGHLGFKPGVGEANGETDSGGNWAGVGRRETSMNRVYAKTQSALTSTVLRGFLQEEICGRICRDVIVLIARVRNGVDLCQGSNSKNQTQYEVGARWPQTC